MRYVPNLIPENSKVLQNYFKGDINKVTIKNPLLDAIMWILGVLFFISALAYLSHTILFILFSFLGLILIPPGHLYLERKLKFRLTPKIKAVATSLLFVVTLPLTNHYSEIDKQQDYQQKLITEKIAKEKAIATQKDKQRRDSLAFYIQQSNHLGKLHKIKEADTKLEYALRFATTQSEKKQIENEKIGIVVIKSLDLVKAGKYKIALPEIERLLELDSTNSELIINRALCNSRTGKIQEAVNDLKPLISNGNREAEKLHNKINPTRNRIVGYETLCYDGTTSSARGRGACSHHGGVRNWNHPIYEESRKYE
jgi:tetratricopeptide (TPR) repeat protein